MTDSRTGGQGGPAATSRTGVVVIGRNEGERLRLALRAARAAGLPVIYSDSGSSDGSLEKAREEAAIPVEAGGPPHTAARARNEGFRALCRLHPESEYVQFVDGDTVLDPGWLEHASAALEADAGLAAVCGHLAERGARSSSFRRLLQLEWRGPVGDIEACGGNAMYRREALDRVGGFRASIVGGEEPELCARLREAGWRVRRIDQPMGVHDSSIDTFSSWWRRAVRVGAAFAALAGDPGSHRHERASGVVRSAMVWGLAVPACLVVSLAGSVLDPRILAVTGAIVLLYVAQTARIAVRSAAGGLSSRDAALYAAFCMLGKLAHVQGWFVHRRRQAAVAGVGDGGAGLAP